MKILQSARGIICSPIWIVNRHFAYSCSDYQARDISDFLKIEPTPQTQQGNNALYPDVSLAFTNTDDCLFIIHISMTDNGKYYFGFSIQIGSMVIRTAPNPYMKDKYGEYDTYILCVIGALRYLESELTIPALDDDNRLQEAAEKALHTVNKLRLKQMTIFDVLQTS